jgi:parvulin-like peptidyl-prolyl isomerase
VALTRLLLVFCAYHAAATASQDAVAAFRDGTITRSELTAWQRFLGRSPSSSEAVLRNDVERLVVLRVLAAQAQREGLMDASAGRAAEGQLARELAVDALSARMRAESVPSEAELRADYDANKASWVKPRRWLLRNILLRAPAGTDREAVRRRAAELRARAAAGEDFAALAQQYSESTTQARKGRIGWTELERLEPGVAQAVEPLVPGAISEVIETGDGFTILKCEGVRPAGVPPYEELRAQRESALTVERLAKKKEALLAELRATTRLDDAPPSSSAGAEAAVYVYHGRDGSSRTLSRAEHEVFLRSRKVDPELTQQQRGQWRDELLLQLGLEEEARRRGILDAPEFKEKWVFEKLRVAAHEALAVRARKDSPVTDQDVAAFYEANRADFVRPEGFRLSAIELVLDDAIPRPVVERAQRVAEDLAAGKLAWADAPAAIDPGGARVKVKDLGWMSRKEFFHLGASAQAAAEALQPGGTSGLVQEAQRLMILRMEEQRPAAPRPLAEVSDRIKKEIARRRGRAAEQAIAAEILATQRVTLTADPPAAP